MPAPPSRHIADWQTAEVNAAAWMRYLGHPDARVTAGGADGGIDVISRTALAQVKFRAHETGAPDVQRLVGAAGRRSDRLKLMFFSGTGYSSKARAYAQANDVCLYVYDLGGVVTAANTHARRALSDAQRREDAAADAALEDLRAQQAQTVAPIVPPSRRTPVLLRQPIPSNDQDASPGMSGLELAPWDTSKIVAWALLASATLAIVAPALRDVRAGWDAGVVKVAVGCLVGVGVFCAAGGLVAFVQACRGRNGTYSAPTESRVTAVAAFPAALWVLAGPGLMIVGAPRGTWHLMSALVLLGCLLAVALRVYDPKAAH